MPICQAIVHGVYPGPCFKQLSIVFTQANTSDCCCRCSVGPMHHAVVVCSGPFITKIEIVAPPSKECFLLNVKDYIPGYKSDMNDVDSDDEEDEAEALL